LKSDGQLLTEDMVTPADRKQLGLRKAQNWWNLS